MAGSAPTRWASQAAQDAMLKFAPQRTSLAEALAQAKQTYGSTVQAGNSTAKLTQQAAERAKPQIGQIYQKANSAQQAGVTLVNKDLAALPGVSNQYKADQAGEVQQQLANLLGARSRDEAMLHQQGVAAQAGAQFNQTSARQTLTKTIADLISKSNTTSQEQGAFAATEAEKLAHEAETLEQRERASQRSSTTSENDSRRSAGASEANSKRSQSGAERRSERSAAAKGAGGMRPLSTVEQGKGVSAINSIRQYAGVLIHSGHTRAEVVERLQKGTPSVSGKSQQSGATFKTAAIPGYKPDVLMSAAIDMAERGGVSKNTWSRLTNAGYTPSYLDGQGIKVKEREQTALHSPAHMGR